MLVSCRPRTAHIGEIEMRKFLLAATLGVAFVTVTLFAQAARLQDPQTQSNQNQATKIKVKDNRAVVADKSKPVRRALEEMYARIAEAQRNKDIDALRATRTADF